MRVLGVDAASKLGWVGVVLDDGVFSAAVVNEDLAAMVAAVEPVEAVGVDIPIGATAGVRQADVAARSFVGSRWQSVFPAPHFEVWELANYEAANAWLVDNGHPKLSQQAWALLPKIREADPVARADDRIYEVHPEVSFKAMAGAELARKKSWEGAQRRRDLLATEGIVLPADLGDAGRAAVDDVLDAAAAAWTANRIARGKAATLPDLPEPSYDGREVAIWY